MRVHAAFLMAAVGSVAASCAGGDSPAGEAAGATTSEPLFVERSAAAGLAGHRHETGATEERFLPETMGGGLGLFDYDVDGWLDLYLVQSAASAGSDPNDPAPVNRLLRGGPTGSFEDRTEESGTGDAGFGMGCAVGDVDNDGYPDLYVLNLAENRLFRNRAGATFEETAQASGVADDRWSVSAGFFDAERDGDLDLYVVNYVVFSREHQRRLFAAKGGKARSYPHPDLFDGAADGFYINDGSGAFTDGSESSGFASVLPGKGLGVAFADVENDGDVDVYVANDSTPNFLFLSDGQGDFEEAAALSGCAYNDQGQTEASMGVDFGDMDGDGLPEVFMTHLGDETNTLYRNRSSNGLAEFEDRTRRSRLGAPSFVLTGFGTAFFDYDSDGLLDLFVANGHIIDNVAEIYPDRTHAQPDLLFRNTGSGVFEDVSDRAGPWFASAHVGRGVAFGDLDRDGDTDLIVSNWGAAPAVLENRATGTNHWIRFELRGGHGEPHDPQGARIEVEAAGRVRVEELWRAYSYASASEAAVHFGLGDAERVERVRVRWPSGVEELWTDLAANRCYRLSRGEAQAEPLR